MAWNFFLTILNLLIMGLKGKHDFCFMFFHRDEDKVKRIPPTKYGTNRGLFCRKVGSNISLVWDIEYEEQSLDSSV